MAKFIRIKHYVINLDTLTYVRVDQDHIDFGFAFPTEKPGGSELRPPRERHGPSGVGI